MVLIFQNLTHCPLGDRAVIFNVLQHILMIDIMNISSEIALRKMQQASLIIS